MPNPKANRSFHLELLRITHDCETTLKNKYVRLGVKLALFELAWKRTPVPVRLFGGIDKAEAAEKFRVQGNAFYNVREFELSVESYNVALSLATSNLSQGLAYANRAAAYLAMHAYRECLESVRLAKNCPLPKSVVEKVCAREKMAIERLNVADCECYQHYFITGKALELSYRSHKRFASFAYCLTPRNPCNSFDGILTTADLLPGDIIVIERPLSLALDDNFFRACSYCLLVTSSLQPCQCSAMFCSSKCKEDAFAAYHDYECSIMDELQDLLCPEYNVVKMFITLVKRFQDVRTLRDYLKGIESPNIFEMKNSRKWPEMESFESQFRFLFAAQQPSLINSKHLPHQNLLHNDMMNNMPLMEAMIQTAMVINLLKKSKPHMAKNADEWKFLAETLCRLLFNSAFTKRSVCSGDISYSSDGKLQVDNERHLGFASYGSALMFRSSCRPNLHMDFTKGNLVVRPIKFIPRGTELLCSTEWTHENAFSLSARFAAENLELSGACFCEECHDSFEDWTAYIQNGLVIRH